MLLQFWFVQQRSFDFDEVFSLRLIDAPLIRIITGQQYDQGTPPLQFTLLKLWQNIVGANETGLRILPLLFSLMAGWYFWLLAKPHLPRGLAVSVVLLAGGNSSIWFFSSYLKPYALLLFLCMFQLWVCQRLFTAKRPGTIPGILLTVSTVAGLYSHYSFVIFSAVLFLSITAFYRRTPVYRHYLQAMVFAGVAYLPWIVYFGWNQLHPAGPGTRYFFHQVLEGWIGWDGWLAVFSNGISLHLPRMLQSPVAAIIFSGMGILVIYGMRKTAIIWQKTLFLFTLATFVLLFLTPLHTVFTEARYTIYGIPLVFFCIASVIKPLWNTSWGKSAVILFTMLTMFTRGWFAETVNTDWKQLVAQIPGGTDAVILADPCHLSYVFTYYYHGELPVYCLLKNPEGSQIPMWDRHIRPTAYILKYTSGYGYEGDQVPWIKSASYQQQQPFGSVTLFTVKP